MSSVTHALLKKFKEAEAVSCTSLELEYAMRIVFYMNNMEILVTVDCAVVL